MDNFELVLSYKEEVAEEYFADFIFDIRETGTDLQTEAHENVPYAALEWVVPTAIAIYIGKPFVDAILKRAADDFGDVVYPKVKVAIQNFVKRVFIREPLSFTVVTTADHKVSCVESTIFSIYAAAKEKKRFKFLFNERLNEEEYLACIDALFAQLADHHSTDVNDSLTKQIAELQNQRAREIYLLYSARLQEWAVADPMTKARELHAKQQAEKTS